MSKTAAMPWMIALVTTGLVACADDPAPMADPAAPDVAVAEERQTEPKAPARKSRPAYRRVVETEGNQPPRVRNLWVEPEEEDGRWRAMIEVDDPDGDHIDLAYSWTVNGEPVKTDGELFDPRDHHRGDRVELTVVATDRHGNAGPSTRTGIMEISNTAPDITSTPPAKMAGGTYRYIVRATDPEGDAPLRYELLQAPEGMRINPYTGELEWRPSSDQTGTHTVEVAVSDSHGGQTTQLFDLPIQGPGA